MALEAAQENERLKYQGQREKKQQRLRTYDLELEVLNLKHRIKVDILEKNKKQVEMMEKPVNDREDQSMRVMKEHKEDLMGFFQHVQMYKYYKYPLIDKLQPIHRGYEVDGILLTLPILKTANEN